jgi:tetratricopeptide (TPR) repeat protein
MTLGMINKDMEDARRWFETSIKYNPKNNVLYENMVGVYVFYQKKAPAIEIQQRLVDLYPNTRTMLILGYLYFRSDSIVKARYWIDKALKLDPFNSDLLIAMSAIAGTDLKLTEALSYTDKILLTNPENLQARLHMAIFGLFTASTYSTKNMLRQLSEEPNYVIEAEELLLRFFP